MGRFTDQDDAQLIKFLANPARILGDPRSLQLYQCLGPQAGPKYKWSTARKPDAWHRRATAMEDLDGKVLREARLVKANQDSPVKQKKMADQPAVRERKKTADVPKTSTKRKGKAKATKNPVEYDVEEDIDRIADEMDLETHVVRDLVISTGSVVRTRELIGEIKGFDDDNDSEGSEEDEEEEEEEEEEEVMKRKVKGKSTGKGSASQKQTRQDDDEDDSDAQPPVKVKVEKKKAPAKQLAAPTKRKKPASKAAARQQHNDDEDDEYDAPKKKKFRSAYHPASAIKPDPDAAEQNLQGGHERAATQPAADVAIPVDRFYARLRPRAYRGGPLLAAR